MIFHFEQIIFQTSGTSLLFLSILYTFTSKVSFVFCNLKISFLPIIRIGVVRETLYFAFLFLEGKSMFGIILIYLHVNGIFLNLVETLVKPSPGICLRILPVTCSAGLDLTGVVFILQVAGETEKERAKNGDRCCSFHISVNVRS